MNQSEFLSQLREALENELSGPAVQDNINYYNNYITEEVRNGKTEAEIMEMLGDPWVLARNIIDSPGGGQRSGSYTYEPSGQNNSQQSQSESSRSYQASGQTSWWRTLLSILVIVGVIVLVLSLFLGMLSVILPILIPILIVVFVVRLISRR